MPPEQIRMKPTERRPSAPVAARRGDRPPRGGYGYDGTPELELSRQGKAVRFAPRITLFVLIAALAIVFAISNRSYSRVFAFIDFGSGVMTLLLLTFSVMWGLVAADRFVLDPGHRLIAQAVHRGTSVGGIIFLGLHIWSKVTLGSTTWQASAVPFRDGAQPILIGLGTISGYMFLAVAVSGAVRGAFARNGQSRLWRALHMGAYVAWGASLVHGLRAGRAVADWVDWGYAVSLAGVAVVLMMRLAPSRPRLGPSKKEQW
jgi:hypothetical protein